MALAYDQSDILLKIQKQAESDWICLSFEAFPAETVPTSWIPLKRWIRRHCVERIQSLFDEQIYLCSLPFQENVHRLSLWSQASYIRISKNRFIEYAHIPWNEINLREEEQYDIYNIYSDGSLLDFVPFRRFPQDGWSRPTGDGNTWGTLYSSEDGPSVLITVASWERTRKQCHRRFHRCNSDINRAAVKCWPLLSIVLT